LTQTSYDHVLIRYRGLVDAPGMATLEEKIKVETQVRELLAQNGLPEPDGVEYGYTCIRLFFDEPKTVLVVDIDGPDPQDDEDEGSGVDVTDPNDDRGGRPLNGFGDEYGAGLN
jgi:hypothetical protein